LLAQIAAGILLLLPVPAYGQQILGRFYPEKPIYLAGEPVVVVLEISNLGPEIVSVADDLRCSMSLRFEARTARHPRETSLYGCSGGGYAGSCASGVKVLKLGDRFETKLLLDGPFRLDTPGVFLIRGSQTVTMWLGSEAIGPPTSVEVTSNFDVTLRPGTETELGAAYERFRRDLESPDLTERGLAIVALTQNPPRILESVILGLAEDSSIAGAAIAGLKRLGTPGAKMKLAQMAQADGPEWGRQRAIQALGELGDTFYCDLMLQIASEADANTQGIAVRAAGYLCGNKALPTVVALLTNADSDLRYELAYALGNTSSRGAVRPLLGLLRDDDPNVRRAAAEALGTLTHRSSTGDLSEVVRAQQAYLDWEHWWRLGGATSPIFSPSQCDESPAAHTVSP
jgi:hypothetical protein